MHSSKSVEKYPTNRQKVKSVVFSLLRGYPPEEAFHNRALCRKFAKLLTL